MSECFSPLATLLFVLICSIASFFFGWILKSEQEAKEDE